LAKCAFLRAKGRKALFISPITLCKQVNYHVSNALNISDLSTTLGISISIFTILGISISIFIVGGFRDVSSEDFQDCFPPSNIDFQINLILGVQSIFKTPIILFNQNFDILYPSYYLAFAHNKLVN